MKAIGGGAVGVAVGAVLTIVWMALVVPAIQNRGSDRSASWGLLNQTEMASLISELRRMPKRNVAIFCAEEVICSNFADDLADALHGVEWQAGVERPMLDDNRGVNIAPKGDAGAQAMAAALTRATAGRIRPGLIDADIGDRLAIIISKK